MTLSPASSPALAPGEHERFFTPPAGFSDDIDLDDLCRQLDTTVAEASIQRCRVHKGRIGITFTTMRLPDAGAKYVERGLKCILQGTPMTPPPTLTGSLGVVDKEGPVDDGYLPFATHTPGDAWDGD